MPLDFSRVFSVLWTNHRQSLIEILFPTLLLSCFKDDDNRQVVEEEMSADMLVKYLRDKKSDSAWNSALVVKTGANSPLKGTSPSRPAALFFKFVANSSDYDFRRD